MAKLKGWQQALTRMQMAKMRTVYAWGSHDCCIYAADAVHVQIGIDFAADFRGQYENEAEADALLANLGYADIGALVSARLPELKREDGQAAPQMATRGDIVLMPGERGNYLAVCDGLTAVGPGLRGIIHAPMEIALRAWRVE